MTEQLRPLNVSMNIIVGIVGAFIGGFLFNVLGGGSNINTNTASQAK